MAHFAKVNNGIVTQVIVAEQSYIDSLVDNEPGIWVQTSYNTRGGVHYQPDSNTPSDDQSKALRGNYAGIGYRYDEEHDIFYTQKPFASWKLNTSTALWEAPITYPSVVDDGLGLANRVWFYLIEWDEIAYRIDNTKGWIATKTNVDRTPHSDTNTYSWNGSSWEAL